MSQPVDKWNDTEAPEEGAIVRVLASDYRGKYVIPFPVIFRDDDWFNGKRCFQATHLSCYGAA